ncbi:DUF2905 domain-containing protein [Desulfosediminicola flagellatus]|uniref:DUF2905 domain-containing protein n=1 Tax=Desulfosediminicola flagellatus TaxID=2569541 RepID=UPI0010ACC8A1|nr:DUF2905 domain-containing protein [Desulfosediminicola flagellatus]
MNKNIILLGVLIIVVGVCWPLLQKIPFGRLPGDIFIKRDGFTFFLPITTCLLVSGVVSLLFWLFRK